MPPIEDPLFDFWYMVCPSRDLKSGKMIGKRMLGQPILIGRDEKGEVFAIRDSCAHRGIPLSQGRFDGREIECCYHGWRFDCKGVCTNIPSLLPSQNFEVSRVKTQRYPVREVQGNIWAFIYKGDQEPTSIPNEPPVAPEVSTDDYKLYSLAPIPNNIDNAVMGLMDPAHGPFVHQNWFWRSSTRLKEKTKAYGPSHLGFTMLRHPPSSNSRVYRIFGGDRTTEISFQLPTTRIEHIRTGKNVIVGMTTLTPLTKMEVELHQIFWWTVPWLGVLRPFLRPFVKRFLNQDRDVMLKLQMGMNDDPQLMMINDADKPSRWYYQLKTELLESREQTREFVNPVPVTTLQWRT
jgi:phenylpropionate dioxygenase-like ring-hydroxylating dioxygenase large terminal subunit